VIQSHVVCSWTLAYFERKRFLCIIWNFNECFIMLFGNLNKQATSSRFLAFEWWMSLLVTAFVVNSCCVVHVSWCGIISPYFVENKRGTCVTVNLNSYVKNYCACCVLWWFHPTRNLLLEEQWFQQDGITLHTAQQKLQLLHWKPRLPFPSQFVWPDIS
jgi:hypothetical protein